MKTLKYKQEMLGISRIFHTILKLFDCKPLSVFWDWQWEDETMWKNNTFFTIKTFVQQAHVWRSCSVNRRYKIPTVFIHAVKYSRHLRIFCARFGFYWPIGLEKKNHGREGNIVKNRKTDQTSIFCCKIQFLPSILFWRLKHIFYDDFWITILLPVTVFLSI